MGVDEVLIDFARLLGRLADRLRRDLVKHHAPNRNFGLENFEQVPRDGFALAVFIRGEVDFVGRFRRLLQVLNGLAPALCSDVVGLKPVFDVDGKLAHRAFLEFCGQIARLREVTDVADRGHDLVVVAQILANRLSLCRRLDDDELLAV